MRNRGAILRRVALGASSAILAGAMAVVASGTAASATDSMTFSPVSGTDLTQITVATIGFCTQGDTNFDISVSGTGINSHPIISANAALPAAGPTGYTVQLSETMATFASEQSPAATLGGAYIFTFNCFPSPTSLGPDVTYSGTMTFT